MAAHIEFVGNACNNDGEKNKVTGGMGKYLPFSMRCTLSGQDGFLTRGIQLTQGLNARAQG